MAVAVAATVGVEIERSSKHLFDSKGKRSEVNTAQKLDTGTTLVSEAGDQTRLLEVDRRGRVVVEVPIKAQVKDHRLQTRMARKLANGNYLVSQPLEKVVREYTPGGEVVWEVKTPDMPALVERRPARQADQRRPRRAATPERQHDDHEPPCPRRGGQVAGGDASEAVGLGLPRW